jgi:hypothetical protein
MNVSGQLQTLAALPTRKRPRYLVNRRLSFLQRRYGFCGEEINLLPLPGKENRIVHPMGLLLYRLRYAGSVKNSNRCDANLRDLSCHRYFDNDSSFLGYEYVSLAKVPTVSEKFSTSGWLKLSYSSNKGLRLFYKISNRYVYFSTLTFHLMSCSNFCRVYALLCVCVFP